jgi:aspartate/methionine/tyrosine aminotransferase
MENIYQWALQNDVTLLSDECYLDMFFEEKNVPCSFLEVAASHNFKNLLCFFSLSKRSGMTGYRTGFIAGDPELIALYGKYRIHLGVGTPDFIQKAAIAAWNDEQHVKERCRIFAKKKNIISQFFRKNDIKFLESNATLYIWGTIPNRYQTSLEFTQRLAETTGILVTAGEVFSPHCQKNFRMALVPTAQKITAVLKAWQEKINEGAL